MSRLTESALAALRLAAGLTARTAAQQLQIHETTLSNWERGSAEPTDARILELAKLYGVSEESVRAAAEKDGLRYLARLSRQRRGRKRA